MKTVDVLATKVKVTNLLPFLHILHKKSEIIFEEN